MELEIVAVEYGARSLRVGALCNLGFLSARLEKIELDEHGLNLTLTFSGGGVVYVHHRGEITIYRR